MVGSEWICWKNDSGSAIVGINCFVKNRFQSKIPLECIDCFNSNIHKTGCPKKMHWLYNVISSKILNLTSLEFLQGWNSVLKDFMWSPQSIQTMQSFENHQIFSPAMIPKITKIIVLNITTCNTLSVFKFLQYYFSGTPMCANLSTAQIIVRAKRSNISN